jgi:lipoprotein Spr
MPITANAIMDTLVPFKCDSVILQNFEKQGIRCNKIQNENLYCEINKWMGVRYKVGGGSFDGTDCTHLVSNLHKAVSGAKIGGNVTHIYGACNPISRDSLHEGDLVFFKINKSNLSHVGLYLQGDLFVHATVNKGVIISSLKEDYYRKYFVGCGRIKSQHYPSNHEKPK